MNKSEYELENNKSVNSFSVASRIKYFEKSITGIVKENNGSYRRNTIDPHSNNNQERTLSVCYDSINKSNSYQDIPKYVILSFTNNCNVNIVAFSPYMFIIGLNTI